MRLVAAAGPIDPVLTAQVLERVGRAEGGDDEPLDVVLASVDDRTDIVALLERWRARLQPAGGIWLLAPKRGQPGYVNGNRLIETGSLARMVDNKVCSVSETLTAMRFVIRRRDRD